jgi:8-oxo-dGTP pyrophosphatase MutT (NUDIX family)
MQFKNPRIPEFTKLNYNPPMPLYRFEHQHIGIYEAVDHHCPRTDRRREVKPDGAWLPKVGPRFPGQVSYWTESGLKRYITSGLQDWHRAVLPSEPTVKIAELNSTANYSDEFQVIAPPEAFELERTVSTNEFFEEQSRGDIIEKVLAFVVRVRNGSKELLVFRHRNHPEAGLQFPAGTVESDEHPDTAVKRELFEESGLNFKPHSRYLGAWTFFKNYSSDFQRRHVYVFEEADPLPDSWRHKVTSDGEDSGLVFEYEWQGLENLEPAVINIEGLGNSLGALQKSL